MSGLTGVIAHVGYPTHAFKAPLIYNPWFEHCGADVIVVPMAAEAPAWPTLLESLLALHNLAGVIVTMPHKTSTPALVDTLTPTARVAGACNAVRRLPDGRSEGAMFDGEGFVAAVRGAGRRIDDASALVVGAGGVGSAIAASLAAAGVARLELTDLRGDVVEALAARLRAIYPNLELATGSNDPWGHDLVVNATPLGMHPGDPLPLDPARLSPGAFVGEVVMAETHTPLLRAALERGCAVQVGTDMLFEQIPAYLDFFGLPVATAQTLRAVAHVDAGGDP